jgi:hypothetical protein
MIILQHSAAAAAAARHKVVIVQRKTVETARLVFAGLNILTRP